MAAPANGTTLELGAGGLPLVNTFGLNTNRNTNLGGNLNVEGTTTFANTPSFTAGNITVPGTIIATTDIRLASGAISVTSLVTKINTTGGGTLTLADGTDGQLKILVLDVDSGTDAVITPTTKTGFSTITMGDAGDAVQLVFVTTRGWICTANQGCALA